MLECSCSPSTLMVSCTARSSNGPKPRRKNRSFGSGQKPPCLIQRPRNSFLRAIQMPSRSQSSFEPNLKTAISRFGSRVRIMTTDGHRIFPPNRNPRVSGVPQQMARCRLSRSSSSSASRLRIQSPVAFSIAEFFCAEKPFQVSTKTFAPNDFAISTVRSVEPESTMMISPCRRLLVASRSPACVPGWILRCK